mgnify:FL=1
MENAAFNSPVTLGNRLSSSGANEMAINHTTTFGPFCGKKIYPKGQKDKPKPLNIPRLFGQENSHPETLQNVELKVGDNKLYLSVKQIAAIGRCPKTERNWQKLKVRTSTPESTTSDGLTPEGTSSVWFYCQVKDSEEDKSYVCIKMYSSGTVAYTGALPYLDIGAVDTIKFHELVCRTVIEKYVIEPGEKNLLLDTEMTWDNLTCQIHYNGYFPGKAGLENAVQRVNELCNPNQLDVSYEPEFTPPQLLVYRVGTIPQCNFIPLGNDLLSPRPPTGTTVKANLCFFKNRKISIAGAKNPDDLKALEETAKKLVLYFLDKEIVKLNREGKFNTGASVHGRLVSLDQYKVMLRQWRKEAEEKKHKKKLKKAKIGMVPDPDSIRTVEVADGCSKEFFYSEEEETYVHWTHIDELVSMPNFRDPVPEIESPQQQLVGIPPDLPPVNTFSGLTGIINDLMDDTEVLQCRESLFPTLSEQMNNIQITLIDSQIHGLQAQIHGLQAHINVLRAQRDHQISGASGGYQTPMHRRPVAPRDPRRTTPRPPSPDQVTEDSGSQQQVERSPTPGAPVTTGVGQWVKNIGSAPESEDESSEDDATPDDPVSDDSSDEDDDAPAPPGLPVTAPREQTPPPNQDLSDDTPTNAVEMVAQEANAELVRAALNEIQTDPTPTAPREQTPPPNQDLSDDTPTNAVEMVAQEANAELVRAALNEIQTYPTPIEERLIGTPGYPEWFDTKKEAQVGQGFYRTPYKVPRCGRCANCNPGAGKKALRCPMVITITPPGRKRKAPTSPKEKPPAKKKTPPKKNDQKYPFVPDKTYTDLAGFEPFLNKVEKHRKFPFSHRKFPGLEFWFKKTPNNRSSGNDWEFIVWDPKKKSSIDLRDTDAKGFELKGTNVSHLRSTIAMERYWDRCTDDEHLTEQVTDDSDSDSDDDDDSDSDSDDDDDNAGGTDDQTDPEPEQPPKEQEPPSAPMQIDTAPKKTSGFKPPSRGVRQNGKAPTQKEKETIRKAMVEYAGTKSREDIARLLISDKMSTISSMSRSRVIGLMKELSPPPIWGASEEKAYQGALLLKPKTPEAIMEYMNRSACIACYDQVHARMQQENPPLV